MPLFRVCPILSICLVCAATILSSGIAAQGVNPTPAQIAQLKSMSQEEQKRLAESFGIEIPGQASNDQPQISAPVTTRTVQKTLPDDNQAIEGEGLEAGEESKPKLKRFGLNLFSQGAEAFLPASDIPIPANYVLGPGDNLVIQLYGKENTSHSLVINREGQIQFPQIGPVGLAGLTFTQAHEAINKIVNEQMIGIKSSVTMGALRSIRVFVLGDVIQPGSYTVGSLSTMTNALFASGGLSEIGSMRNIQLKRNGKLVTTLDLYDLLLKGDTSQDSRLLPGDVIFVPPLRKSVNISGEVRRPANYELTEDTSIEKLIQVAGGLTENAFASHITITRSTASGEKELISLNLQDENKRNYKINTGDVVEVGALIERVQSQISLVGHLKRPGNYQWHQGIRFTDLVPSSDLLEDNPDINIALIIRKTKKVRQLEALTFSPITAWNNPNTKENPELFPDDELFIFDFDTDRTELLEELNQMIRNQSGYMNVEKTVTILGSVRFEGTYPLVRDMDISQLVLLSGGLKESAFGLDAEITRYELNQDMERVVSHIPINLNEQTTRLKEGDTLQIKRIPKWKEKETVDIQGEVVFPGTYTLLPGETLLDVIQRAGGLTEYAFPKGAIFSRQNLRDLEASRLAELKLKLEADIASASATEKTGEVAIEADEAETILANIEQTKPLGRMVINLPAIISGKKDNFQLENGDRLTIPRFKPSVTVLGEVQYPTSHFFDNKLSPSDYIKSSGGMKLHADKKRVYIVKANGRVIEPSKSFWFRGHGNEVEPGDTIIVPLNADQVDPLTVWGKVTTIIYQAALGAAAVNTL